MSTDTDSENNIHTFTLGEVIDISVINSMYDGLKLLLNEARHVVIDAKDVKRIDTSALQLLCCWYKETQDREIAVSWKNIEGVFMESSNLLGVSDALALEK